MPDDWFLPLFHRDTDEAARLYAKLRQKLVFFFERHRCHDPEDLADEAIERAMSALRRGATITTTLGGFCYGIAKRLRLEELHDKPETELVEEASMVQFLPPHKLTAGETGILLEEYLSMLPVGDRKLLERYHLEDRRTLAAELQKSENALRVEICRIKRSLLEHIGGGKVHLKKLNPLPE